MLVNGSLVFVGDDAMFSDDRLSHLERYSEADAKQLDKAEKSLLLSPCQARVYVNCGDIIHFLLRRPHI